VTAQLEPSQNSDDIKSDLIKIESKQNIIKPTPKTRTKVPSREGTYAYIHTYIP